MFIGIDCGTQGTKALLIDEAGTTHGRGYAAHRIIERSTGAREQEPQWWVDAMVASVKQAVAQRTGSEVKALGVSGQQHGLVVLDETMQVIRPAKLWNDTETAKENADLIERFGGPTLFFERFGVVPLTGYTVSKLLWMKRHEPANFERIRHILLPHEYLNFYLTGQLCAEYGDASGTAFFDPRSRAWIREILDEIDGGTDHLFRALPRLLKTDEPVGYLRPEIAKLLGLPDTCLVSPGGGDNMMGAIGTGNVREGMVTLSLGTSSTVYSYRDQPSHDPTGCVAPFCSSSGGWLPLVCTMNATNVVTQTVTLLGKTVADIDSALDSTASGADGLTLIPFLNGERTPDLPHATGTLLGISSINFTPAHLIRAAVEGVSFGVIEGLRLILAGAPAEKVRVIGGGARSTAWRQLLADAVGAIIEVPLEEEAGCLGAAMQAIYFHEAGQGRSVPLSTITDRCVKLDEAKTMHPRADEFAGYQASISRYRRYLSQVYGA